MLARTALALVTVVAALFVAAGPAPAAAAPSAAPVAAAGAPCDDACKIGGARSYVASLVSHDPSTVPFHPKATRVEAALQTGFSGRQLRFDLRHGLQYRIIRAVDNASYRVQDGRTVVADFTLDVGLGPIPLLKSRVHETFTFDEQQAGLIRRIVADIALGDGR